MKPDRRQRVWTFLNRPMFGTKVIPADARVDPAEFPDDEFPVYCEKCGYLLRGLAEPRCPECGTAFDRGRLLVRQYVVRHEDLAVRYTVLGRWGYRVFLLGLIGYFGITLGFATLVRWFQSNGSLGGWTPSAPGDSLVRAARVDVWASIGFLVLMVVGGILMGTAASRSHGKRRRVLNAIDSA